MNEEQKPHKTWIMLKKAIPPIIPTAPNSGSGTKYIQAFDAQWNTANGHDAKATQLQFIKGTNSSFSGYPYCNLKITNGKFVDNNYLLLDGTGVLAPVTQKWFATNNGEELVVLDGLGEIYTKTVEGATRKLVLTETSLTYTHNYNQLSLDVPGKDIRMIALKAGYLTAYDKNGNRYQKYSKNVLTLYSGMQSCTDTSYFFNGFVGKVYCLQIGFDYWDGTFNNAILDAEWLYNKNRFRL